MPKPLVHKPLVSVVMATYNQAEFLPRAIDSVMAQTFHDFEFIIVDDGSTDNTESILNKYQDSRIKIIKQQNQGMAAARNNGVEAALGKYVAFMDSDDACAKNRLEVQLRFLEKKPNLDACSCSVLPIGRYTPGHMEEHTRKPWRYNRRPVFAANKMEGILGPATLITRRSFMELKGYRGQRSIIEDLDFTLRYSRHYKWIFIERSSLYFYRYPNYKRKDQLSSQNLFKFIKRHINCFVSEWSRHNNLPDPVEEGRDLEEITSRVVDIGWRGKYMIYKTMRGFVGEVSAFKNISLSEARWYLLEELKFSYWPKLITWLLLEIGHAIRNKLRVFRPILVAMRIKQPLGKGKFNN